jgi:hypothetical protein
MNSSMTAIGCRSMSAMDLTEIGFGIVVNGARGEERAFVPPVEFAGYVVLTEMT